MITDFSSVDETHSYDAYCHISNALLMRCHIKHEEMSLTLSVFIAVLLDSAAVTLRAQKHAGRLILLRVEREDFLQVVFTGRTSKMTTEKHG